MGVTGDPATRQALADAYIGDRVETFVNRRAAELARGGTPGPEGSLGKLIWTEGMRRTSDVISRVLGPALIADTGEWGTFAWGEHVLGAPGYRIAGGSDEVQRNIIGERVLGLPAEPRVDKDVAVQGRAPMSEEVADARDDETFQHRDRCAISGIGWTDFSRDSGRSELTLATQAVAGRDHRRRPDAAGHRRHRALRHGPRAVQRPRRRPRHDPPRLLRRRRARRRGPDRPGRPGDGRRHLRAGHQRPRLPLAQRAQRPPLRAQLGDVVAASAATAPTTSSSSRTAC